MSVNLLILNDPPYGAERGFNGLRLAKALAGKGNQVIFFLTRHGLHPTLQTLEAKLAAIEGAEAALAIAGGAPSSCC